MIRAGTVLQVGIGGLIAVQLLFTFGVVALLDRMGPAIGSIVDEHTESSAAVEVVLAVLARAETAVPLDAAATTRLDSAIATLQGSSRSGGDPLVARIAGLRDAAVAGDTAARRSMVASATEIAADRRSMMRAADEEAQRLGIAGAWATVLLGSLAFGMAVLVLQRTQRLVLRPLQDLDDVLRGIRSGEHLRRCRGEGPLEFARIASTLNEILDARSCDGREPPNASPGDTDRAALLQVLDDVRRPVMVVDADGHIATTNQQAADLLAGERGPALRNAARALARAPGGPEDGPFADVAPLERSRGWLVSPGTSGDSARTDDSGERSAR